MTAPVSRETPAGPPPGPLAGSVFADALSLARIYADLLAGPGVERGLIGPREVDRLWERHLLNCAAIVPLIPRGSRVVDVGSGAGLPGIVIALLRPDVPLVLLEPLLRRATFLSEVVERLGLDERVSVRRARAQDLPRTAAFDVATARAVAPLDRLAGWTLPLLRPEGLLLAMKGERAAAELAAAGPMLRRLGASGGEILRVGSAATPTTVVRVTAGRPG